MFLIFAIQLHFIFTFLNYTSLYFITLSLLNRFDIDIATPIFVDTLRAENLKTAWSKRQEELKIAMASVAKPAEFMAEIALKLRENNQSLNECIESLKELESLLSDIDNARDFYTIGELTYYEKDFFFIV